jgi:pyruvate dehydrogenase E1 component alpha subunit
MISSQLRAHIEQKGFNMQVGKEKLLWMCVNLVQIRYYEETMGTVFMDGKIPSAIKKGLAFDKGAGPVPGEMQLANGQDSVAVGIGALLTDEDTVFGSDCSHHFAIAKGVPLEPMTAEMFGNVTGLGKVKDGHLQLCARWC